MAAATVESPDERPSSLSSRWRWVLLGAVIVITVAARVWIIRHYPEPDGDAKGHLGIAASLLGDPFNVAKHWVWPPGYHFYLAGLMALGVTSHGFRLIDCALAALLPVLVWLYAARTLPSAPSRSDRVTPFLAALLFAIMPVVNLMGTSAQQESLFTIMVLAVVWSFDRGRFALGGALLAAATMVRYEAAGGAALLLGAHALGRIPAVTRRLPAPLARACRLPLVASWPTFAIIGAWLLAHRLADGTWFGFLRELYRYTHIQRDSFHQDPWHDLLWFPVLQPYYLFGLSLPLFFVGIRRAWRESFLVPLGIYLFLVGSYAFKGVLGSGRYYESLTPFVCIAAAYGAAVIGERRRWAQPLVFAGAFAHVAWLLLLNIRWTFGI